MTVKPLNAVNVTIVDAPDVSLTPDDKTGDLLLHFYRALGWNGEDILDPCKVRTTKEVYGKLYEQMCERCPDYAGVGMLLMNSGPGTEDNIPHGKVYLMEGWVTPVAERFALPGDFERGEFVNGYEIQRAIVTSDDGNGFLRGYAIGHNPEAVSQWVCWQFAVRDGERHFNWGDYACDEQTVIDSYNARVFVALNRV